MKKIVYILTSLVLVASSFAYVAIPASAATTLQPDTVIKGTSLPTLFYYAADGKRYVFLNEPIYHSWFTSFDNIVTLSDADLAQIPLGGAVTYRPGILMIKVPTDPKVYAVGQNGELRWVKTEAIARALYGDNWNKLIDEIPLAFLAGYHLGLDINSTSDFNTSEEIDSAPTISHDHGLHLGQIKHESDTEKCRAVPAIPAHKVGKKGPATPAISARDCARAKQGVEDQEGGFSLFSVSATATTTSAVITWSTNQDSTSRVTYNTQPLTATSTNQMISDSTLVKAHSMTLTGLTAGTTYYYQAESTNSSNQTVKSSQKTFTTTTVADTTAPVISSIVAAPAITSAVITWTTNESSNSSVDYATTTLGTSTNILNVNSVSMVTSHSVTLTGLSTSTAYYFRVKSTDASSNTATSSEMTFTTLAPDVTAPVISSIVATPAGNSVVITWTTNESSNSSVDYATTTLATATNILNANSSSLVTAHSITITGLNQSTVYYFKVKSTDASSNTATSSEMTFTTLDTIAPVISSIAATPAATSAVITWTTDEPATSVVKYANDDLTTAATILTSSDTTLVTSHSITLTGLTSNTTYHFRVESTDASSNTATSTQHVFVTTL